MSNQDKNTIFVTISPDNCRATIATKSASLAVDRHNLGLLIAELRSAAAEMDCALATHFRVNNYGGKYHIAVKRESMLNALTLCGRRAEYEEWHSITPILGRLPEYEACATCLKRFGKGEA